MAVRRDIINIWKNIQELDLHPIRESAEREVKIALVGAPSVGKRTLATQLRSDPDRPNLRTMVPVIIANLDIFEQASLADVIVLMIDVNAEKVAQEQKLLNQWLAAGDKVIIFCNKLDQLREKDAVIPWLEARQTTMIYGSAIDRDFLQRDFATALINTLPEHHLALGRLFPLLREPIAHNLINQTCFANAAYALGTGLAEIVPLLDIPLNVADIIILTKAQALLVYKLGLVLGLSPDWQYYVAEFGSVVGSGFVWRQIARQMVGLIPVWGLVPKVAVAYSGTYVVGNVVVQWYLTGRHLTRKRMRELSRQAFDQGETLARNLLEKVPRPRLGRRKQLVPQLATGEQFCTACGKANDSDASFCKNCGQGLSVPSVRDKGED